ncbi:MAG: hypothetical protein V4757_14150, partial [Pseudomonadota bacterium]
EVSLRGTAWRSGFFTASLCVIGMQSDYYHHPQRFPKNVSGPFYTLGDQRKDGSWCGQCLSCETPENEAPTLLAPLTAENADTYFVRQPQTEAEIEQACCAVEVCCVDALRYGGRDPTILRRLQGTNCCDLSKRWWEFWK